MQYVGIDLPRYGLWGLRVPSPELLLANAAHMPFPDNTFDTVLVRDVFGQYKTPDKPDPDNSRTWGMYEAFRVLKPGGKIVIDEENTPWSIHAVESFLKSAGFCPSEYIQSTDSSQEKALLELRSQFYNDKYHPYRLNYILIAEKPEQPNYEYISAEVRRHLDPEWKTEVFTIFADTDFWPKEKTELITTITYKKGQKNTNPSIIPRKLRW